MMFPMCALMLSAHCTRSKFTAVKAIRQIWSNRMQVPSIPSREPDQMHQKYNEIWHLMCYNELFFNDRELETSVKDIRASLAKSIKTFKKSFRRRSRLLYNNDLGVFCTHELETHDASDPMRVKYQWKRIMDECLYCCIGLWRTRMEAVIAVKGSMNHSIYDILKTAYSSHAERCIQWLRKEFAYSPPSFNNANSKTYENVKEYYSHVYALFKKLEDDVQKYFMKTLIFFYSHCTSDISLRIANGCFRIMLEERFTGYMRLNTPEMEVLGAMQLTSKVSPWLAPHMLHTGIIKKTQLALFDRIVELHGSHVLPANVAAQVEDVMLSEVLEDALKGESSDVLIEILEQFTKHPSLNREANRTTAFVGFQLVSLAIIRAVQAKDVAQVAAASKPLSAFHGYYMDNIARENGEADTASIVELSKQVVATLWDICRGRAVQYEFWAEWYKITGETLH